MEDNKKTDAVEAAEEVAVTSKRKFLKSAAQVAVTAPAAMFLLNAATMRSAAAVGADYFTAAGATDSGEDTQHCATGNPQLVDDTANHAYDCL